MQVLVRYHEIALKGGNRPFFLDKLSRNLARATSDIPGSGVRRLAGRISLEVPDDVPWDRVRERVRSVFGVANFSRIHQAPPDAAALEEAVLRELRGRSFGSFRVTTRRGWKGFALRSGDIDRALGAAVNRATGVRVDLERPEMTLFVEVHKDRILFSFEKEPGPGGFPAGSSGRVLALLSGGIDSPVAAWRMMKRGCRVVFVHFHSVPYLPPTSQAKARTLVERLTEWQYASRLYLVPFGEIQREVVLSVPPPARVVVYRRLMVRIAEAIARGERALALATGESLGQVASQTLENIAAIDAVAAGPVFRPLIGTDKIEITAEAKRLGTFETSIEPDADCCTLFVPAHPHTRMTVAEAEAVESRLDLVRLVAAGVEGATLESFQFPAGVPAGR